jgi:hypothetical protein
MTSALNQCSSDITFNTQSINTTNAEIKDFQITFFKNGNYVTLWKSIKHDTIDLVANVFRNDNQKITTLDIISHPYIGNIAVHAYNYTNFLVAWSTLATSASDWQISLGNYHYHLSTNTFTKQIIQVPEKSPKFFKGKFAFTIHYNNIFISIITNVNTILTTKYKLVREIVENTLQNTETECFRKPLDIISKIASDDTIAVAWNNPEAIFIQHYYGNTLTLKGIRYSISVKSLKLFIDISNTTTLIGWESRQDACYHVQQNKQYNDYYVRVINRGHNMLSKITQVNYAITTVLYQINIINSNVYGTSLITYNQDLVYSIFYFNGTLITSNVKPVSEQTHTNNRHMYVQQDSFSDLQKIIFVSTVLLRNVIITIPYINLDSLLSNAIKGVGRCIQQSKCNSKLIYKSTSGVTTQGNNINPHLKYYTDITGIKYYAIYSTITDSIISLIYKKEAVSEQIIQNRYIENTELQLTPDKLVITDSYYSLQDLQYKLQTNYIGRTDASKIVSSERLLPTFYNGIFTTITKDSSTIIAFFKNENSIQINKFASNDINTDLYNDVQLNVCISSPMLLKSAVVSNSMFVLLYGSPIHQNINIECRNIDTGEVSSQYTISKIAFSHISLTASYVDHSQDGFTVAWQNMNNDGSYGMSFVQKFTSQCTVGTDISTGILSTDNNVRLQSIKWIDNYLVGLFSYTNKYEVAIYQNAFGLYFYWKPDIEKNPLVKESQQPQTMNIDYITPFIHYQDPDCELANIYISYSTEVLGNSQIYADIIELVVHKN